MLLKLVKYSFGLCLSFITECLARAGASVVECRVLVNAFANDLQQCKMSNPCYRPCNHENSLGDIKNSKQGNRYVYLKYAKHILIQFAFFQVLLLNATIAKASAPKVADTTSLTLPADTLSDTLLAASGIKWAKYRFDEGNEGITVMQNLSTYPISIKFIWLLTFLLLLTCVTLVVILVYTRFKKAREKYLIDKTKRDISDLLHYVLFDEELEAHINADPKYTFHIYAKLFDKYLQRDMFTRGLLLDELIQLHKVFSGESGQKLQDIYLSLGLRADSLAKLKSTQWHIKAMGISEFTQMGIKDYYSQILPLTNSDYPVLRSAAITATIKLNSTNPFAFLDNITIPLTEWDQINILSIVSTLDKASIPDFSQWLTSTNETVVELVVKLIGYYNQSGAVDALMATLHHKNDNVKIEVIKTLRDLQAIDSLPVLVGGMSWVGKAVKLEIIRVIAYLNPAPYLKLLLNFLQGADDYDLRMATCRAILAAGEDGQAILNSELAYADVSLQQIIKHVLDDRISE